MKLRIYAIVLILNITTIHTLAQTVAFKNYTIQHGLPSSEVYCSLQDKKGYMWFGTDRGLVKFDGYNFKVFTTTEGMPDNTIFMIKEDCNGDVWFVSFSSDIGYIKNDTIKKYTYNSLAKATYPYELINTIIIDNEGGLYIGKRIDNTSEKIFHIDKNGHIDTSTYAYTAGRRKLYYHHPSNVIINNPLGSVDSIAVYTHANKHALGHIYSDQKLITSYSYTLGDTNEFVLIVDNKLYINKDTLKHLRTVPKQVLSLSVDKQKNIWIGYRKGGVEVYSVSNNYRTKKSYLKDKSISSICPDNEGGIWITTLENGLYYQYPNAPLVYTEENGWEPDEKRFVKNENHIILVPSNGHFLQKKEAEDQFTICPPYNYDIAYCEKNAMFYSLASDWKLERNHSINYFKDTQTKRKNVGCKIHLGAKYIWAYTYSSFAKFDYYCNRILLEPTNNIPKIRCVFENKDGSILIGTLGGVYRFKQGVFTPIKQYNPLLDCRISNIERVDNNHLAVATIGNGCLIINDTNYTSAVSITTENGLPSMMCNVVYSEDDSTLWIGTNFGASRLRNVLNNDRRTCVTFTSQDGIVSNEIYAIQSFEGKVWLVSPKGVSIISGIDSITQPYIPLYIQDVFIDNEPVQNPTDLSYNQNNITFSYSGLSYQHAASLTYAYRIEEINNKWQYTTNRAVSYNSLPPGNYTFELGVLKPGQKNILATTKYAFIIKPPFWNTWWFILFSILTLAFVSYLLINTRIQTIKSRVHLKHELKSYRDKALRAQMSPHFIYNALNSIQNYILKNSIQASASYLSKFSQLMRLSFNNTNVETVSLEKDLDALRLYAELERLRFKNSFTLHIEVTGDIDLQKLNIPPLILQPFVENSILHGLRPKATHGNIWVNIRKKSSHLEITIADDGIGRSESKLIKERKAKYSQSFNFTKEDREHSAITTTVARIEHAWDNNNGKSNFRIIDLFDADHVASGTTIQFNLPLHYDQSDNN